MLREIFSSECFLGWPSALNDGPGQQVDYIFLSETENVIVSKEGDWTVVRAADYSWSRRFSGGLEPVIVRRPR